MSLEKKRKEKKNKRKISIDLAIWSSHDSWCAYHP